MLQLKKRRKSVLKGHESNPHEVFVSDTEQELDARTLIDQCEVRSTQLRPPCLNVRPYLARACVKRLAKAGRWFDK